MKERKKYTEKQKIEIVKEWMNSGATAFDIGKKYGVYDGAVNRWKKKYFNGNQNESVEKIREREKESISFVNSFKKDFRLCRYLDKFLEDGEDWIWNNSVMLSNVIIQKLFDDDLYNQQKGRFFDVNLENASSFSSYILNNEYLKKLIVKYIRIDGMYAKNFDIAYLIASEFLVMVEEDNDDGWMEILKGNYVTYRGE